MLIATVVGNRPQFVKAAAVSRKLRAMPEELNRVLADHASELLFCSTETAVENRRKEGIHERLYLVGDVMADVALTFLPVAEERSTALADSSVEEGAYVLVTVHRPG